MQVMNFLYDKCEVTFLKIIKAERYSKEAVLDLLLFILTLPVPGKAFQLYGV